MATQMQLKALFGRKSHGFFLERKNSHKVVCFSALCFMFTLTWITEKELERVIKESLKTKQRAEIVSASLLSKALILA